MENKEVCMVIRKATIEDVTGIYTLLCDLEEITFDKEKFINRYKANLTDKNKMYYVYELNNCVVGFISLFVKKQLHHEKDTGEIEELIVDGKYRSQGIGRELIEYIYKKAKELDLQEIEVSSKANRIRAHHFYESNEFIKSHYKLVRKG